VINKSRRRLSEDNFEKELQRTIQFLEEIKSKLHEAPAPEQNQAVWEAFEVEIATALAPLQMSGLQDHSLIGTLCGTKVRRSSSFTAQFNLKALCAEHADRRSTHPANASGKPHPLLRIPVIRGSVPGQSHYELGISRG
jgi:hypothetical protein